MKPTTDEDIERIRDGASDEYPLDEPVWCLILRVDALKAEVERLTATIEAFHRSTASDSVAIDELITENERLTIATLRRTVAEIAEGRTE